VRDDVGFLTINFQHRLSMTFEPFIFPSQVTQIFFYDNLKKLGWKVVLQKEAYFRKEVANLEDVFITNNNGTRWAKCSNGTIPTSKYTIFNRCKII